MDVLCNNKQRKVVYQFLFGSTHVDQVSKDVNVNIWRLCSWSLTVQGEANNIYVLHIFNRKGFFFALYNVGHLIKYSVSMNY